MEFPHETRILTDFQKINKSPLNETTPHLLTVKNYKTLRHQWKILRRTIEKPQPLLLIKHIKIQEPLQTLFEKENGDLILSLQIPQPRLKIHIQRFVTLNLMKKVNIHRVNIMMIIKPT